MRPKTIYTGGKMTRKFSDRTILKGSLRSSLPVEPSLNKLGKRGIPFTNLRRSAATKKKLGIF